LRNERLAVPHHIAEVIVDTAGFAHMAVKNPAMSRLGSRSSTSASTMSRKSPTEARAPRFPVRPFSLCSNVRPAAVGIEDHER
jgi:hypothetical protein